MDDHAQPTSWLKALSGADEVQARRFAAAKALELGWGGITKVVKLTGMSHT
ncbi:MAG: ISAzo13 family transposase, partial [Candidatus Methanogaster sp.]